MTSTQETLVKERWKFWLTLFLPLMVPLIAAVFWLGSLSSNISSEFTSQRARATKFENRLEKKLDSIVSKIEALTKSDSVLTTRVTLTESKVQALFRMYGELKAQIKALEHKRNDR